MARASTATRSWTWSIKCSAAPLRRSVKPVIWRFNGERLIGLDVRRRLIESGTLVDSYESGGPLSPRYCSAGAVRRIAMRLVFLDEHGLPTKIDSVRAFCSIYTKIGFLH